QYHWRKTASTGGNVSAQVPGLRVEDVSRRREVLQPFASQRPRAVLGGRPAGADVDRYLGIPQSALPQGEGYSGHAGLRVSRSGHAVGAGARDELRIRERVRAGLRLGSRLGLGVRVRATWQSRCLGGIPIMRILLTLVVGLIPLALATPSTFQ